MTANPSLAARARPALGSGHQRGRRYARCVHAVGILGFAIVSASAAGAQGPSQPSHYFDSGISLSGAWLQANALPMDRDALQSGSIAVALRRSDWSAELGWLRVARTLSTVEGGSLTIGRVLRWKAVEFIPNVGALVGRAYASADTTGYDWTATGGVTGHTPRYTYSEGGTFGGSVGLTVEVPLFSVVAARGMVSQWYFSGSPLEGDRARTLLGAGLSVRVGR
jgi:hypothetical protein